MDGVVGRAAGRVQADDAVDDGPLVDDRADRRVGVAERRDGEGALCRRPGQRIAERRVRVDEARARQVQPHDLHEHLVGIGGAVEGAGTWPVIALGLRLEQFRPADLALGIELADARLLRVGQPRSHRPGRDEHRRQMTEGERGDEQARHDLVADAEEDRGVEHVVGEADARRHGNRVAREQRQLHAHLALCDPVAHRRHAAGDLRHAAGGARRGADQLRIAFIGLMGREHVVVGGDDAEIGHHVAGERRLVGRAAGREAVGEVAAGEAAAVGAAFLGRAHAVEVARTVVGAPSGDPFGHLAYAGMDSHRNLLRAIVACRLNGRLRARYARRVRSAPPRMSVPMSPPYRTSALRATSPRLRRSGRSMPTPPRPRRAA